tara:strand:- start:89027 stop:91081 length:2055 start_codon:yes stop_codon:yes gene_type:complete
MMLMFVFNLNAQHTIIPNEGNFELLESKSLFLEDGKIRVKNPEMQYRSTTLPFECTTEDVTFDIEIDAKDLSVYKRMAFTLYLNSDEYLFFYVSTKGSVFAKHFKQEKIWEQLADWDPIENKLTSPKIPLKIVKKGKKIEVYVNGNRELKYKTDGGRINVIAINQAVDEGLDWTIEKWTSSTPMKYKSVKKMNAELTEKPTKLSLNVNTTGMAELNPQITGDGQALFFTRKYEVAKDDTDDKAMVALKGKNGEWEKAIILPSPINKSGISTSTVSPGIDGSRIYINGMRGAQSDKYGISMSTIEGGKFTYPEPYEIKKWTNKASSRTRKLSNDEQILICAFNDGESNGQLDLYVSFREEKLLRTIFTEPINLGPIINTGASENFGFLAADNKTLYFSSSGHHGYGSSDIFMAKRLDDTWTNWSEPVNMGPIINSLDWDGYFSTDAEGKLGFIAGTRDGQDFSDVYQVPLFKETQPDPVIIVKGKVLDQKTNEPIDADIFFRPINIKEGEAKTIRSDKKTGAFTAIFQKGYNYEVVSEKKGYFPISEYLKLDSLEDFASIEKNLYLKKIEKGEVIRLNNIFFDFGKASLKEESFYELDRLYNLMSKNGKMQIEIGGHTDNVGSADYNKKLSNERAEAVVNYLVKKGIEKGRLTFNGYGPDKPVATNETEEGRALNRRVEFKIVSN